MPKGVEHHNLTIRALVDLVANQDPMPKGVEHQTEDGVPASGTLRTKIQCRKALSTQAGA